MAAIDHFTRWRQKALPNSIPRIFLVLIFLILILSFIPYEDAQAQQITSIEVGYYNNRPLSYRNGNGEVNGLSADLLKMIAKEEGWNVHFNEGTIEECQNWLADEEIDIVLGMEEVVACHSLLQFSNETIISNWGVIFSTTDIEISSIIDLEGMWLGIVKGDIYYSGNSGLKNLLDSFKIETFIVEFNNYNELLGALEDGQIDAGLLNHLLSQAIEDDWEIFRTGIVFNPLDIKFGYPINGTNTEAISTSIDRRLGELKEDGNSVYYSLIEEYVGGNGGPEVRVILPRWLINLFFGVIGVAVFLFAMTMFLRYRVRVRTKELRRSNELLDMDIRKRKEAENRLKDERNRSVFYLDLLVHDVGNINQGLLNSSQIYNMVKEDRKKADSIHKTIEQLVKRSVVLLKNVSKFAQATTAPFDPVPIELMPMIKKALSGVILSFPEADIDFNINGPGKKVYIPAEPLLEEVFHNIFHNAAKYHDLITPKIDVNVFLNEGGKTVTVEITDRGKGIPDQMKSRLFSRADKAEEAKHIGMGLSLVKVLLDRYDGTIEVKDRVPDNHSMGSKFIVILPVMQATSNPLNGIPKQT
jgi:signal transduction histidine kinase